MSKRGHCGRGQIPPKRQFYRPSNLESKRTHSLNQVSDWPASDIVCPYTHELVVLFWYKTCGAGAIFDDFYGRLR